MSLIYTPTGTEFVSCPEEICELGAGGGSRGRGRSGASRGGNRQQASSSPAPSRPSTRGMGFGASVRRR